MKNTVFYALFVVAIALPACSDDDPATGNAGGAGAGGSASPGGAGGNAGTSAGTGGKAGNAQGGAGGQAGGGTGGTSAGGTAGSAGLGGGSGNAGAGGNAGSGSEKSSPYATPCNEKTPACIDGSTSLTCKTINLGAPGYDAYSCTEPCEKVDDCASPTDDSAVICWPIGQSKYCLHVCKYPGQGEWPCPTGMQCIQPQGSPGICMWM